MIVYSWSLCPSLPLGRDSVCTYTKPWLLILCLLPSLQPPPSNFLYLSSCLQTSRCGLAIPTSCTPLNLPPRCRLSVHPQLPAAVLPKRRARSVLNQAAILVEFAGRSADTSPPCFAQHLTPSRAVWQKCDEQRRDDGGCTTCQRLSIQCLGYGAKRPEHLRVSSRIVSQLDVNTYRLCATQGKQQGHLHPREDQSLPCCPRNDQRPLWIWRPRRRTRTTIPHAHRGLQQ